MTAAAPTMTRQVVLATRNPHKVRELRRILTPYDVVLVGLDEFPDAPDVAETGATFAENALLKARSAAAVTGLVAVADDSGLAVDALNGMPGVLSVYWAGRARDDEANLRLVLEQLEDVPDERRGAAFVCAAAAVAPDGREIVVEGRMEGTIRREAARRRRVRLRPHLRAGGGEPDQRGAGPGGEGRDQSPGGGLPRVGAAPRRGAALSRPAGPTMGATGS